MSQSKLKNTTTENSGPGDNKSNGLITRDIISNPPKRRYKVFDIEGIGRVRVRTLNALEKIRHDNMPYEPQDNGTIKINWALRDNILARLVVLTVVDDDGNQIFTPQDINRLMEMDASVFDRLASACVEMQEVPEKN